MRALSWSGFRMWRAYCKPISNKKGPHIYHFVNGSGYGYGTVPGGRWTIDTEGGHVVVSVSLIRNGYEYGTVPHLRGTIHTESGHVVNSVS